MTTTAGLPAAPLAARMPSLLSPPSISELRRLLAIQRDDAMPIVPLGCGSKSEWLARPAAARIVSLRQLCSIVAHEAADLTVTVEAGATVAELNAVLMSAGQHLPVDPPLPRTTTIGSLIAGDLFGPLRLSQGKVRDLLLGVTVVLADGRLVHGGGRVVKNVAGYDLMKLFTGSGGTLGIVAEATFKLRPYPSGISQYLVPAASLSEACDTGRRILAAGLTPFYLVAVSGPGLRTNRIDSPSLLLACAGSTLERDAERQRLGALVGLDEQGPAGANAVYGAVRDAPAMALDPSSLGARVSLLPSVLSSWLEDIAALSQRVGTQPTIVAHPGNGAAILRWSGATMDLARRLVEHTQRAGGWLELDVIPRGLRGELEPWPMQPPGIELMRRIKRCLDPLHRLNPGKYGNSLA